MIMTIMCDDVHICTYSMQLEVPDGHLCPKGYIIAFQMFPSFRGRFEGRALGENQRIFGSRSNQQNPLLIPALASTEKLQKPVGF